MDYYFSIFIRELNKSNFKGIAETVEKFCGHLDQTERDLVVGRTTDVNILGCLFKMKENYPKARFGFSQYSGLAKGLSKIAQFGEILVSEEVEKKIIENYEITSLGMLSIEGMASQILVYRAEKPIKELLFPTPKPEAMNISRQSQIESLQNLMSVSNAVLVIAPPGSGKTIFLNQLIEHWGNKIVYRTTCPPYVRAQTFKPITEIVNQLFGLVDVEGFEEKQKIIENKLKDLDIIDIGTSYLAILDFLSLSEEESILEKLELKVRVDVITDSVAEVLKRISWTTPTVIIIEDVENLDASSVKFIQHLILKLAEENVCFIFSSSLSQVNISGLKEFELRDIEKDKLELLIEEQTGEKLTLPPTTPFHISQYLLLYREEKAAYFYNQYRGETSISEFSLPLHDIKTIIKRRVDLLEENKEFLYNLAVAGLEINPEEFPIDKSKFYLFEYFVKHGYLMKFLNRYIFVNVLMQEEIYNLVTDKKNRHLRLADYYSRLQGFEEQAAFHYQAGENYKKAVDYLIKSAAIVVAKGGYESGIDYYNQALELCQRQKEAADLEVLVAINEGLADIYRALGDEEKALKYYKVVLDSYKEILKE
jgi:tetratricopeptide (TPR) repeat protein